MIKPIIYLFLQIIIIECVELENPVSNLTVIEVKDEKIYEMGIMQSQTIKIINFENSSSTIGMQVFSSNESQLSCTTFDQTIKFDTYQKNELEILKVSSQSYYTDQSLKINRTQNINDPEFIIHNPILVGLVNTTQGLLLLSSNHILILMNLTFSAATNRFYSVSNTTFNFSSERPNNFEQIQPHLMWNEKKQCIFIIYPQQIISGKFDSNGNLDFLTNKIKVVNELEYIRNVKIQNDLAFVSRGRKGIEIYNITETGEMVFFKSLLDQLDQITSSVNIIDFSFGGDENNLILILDKYKGLIICEFNVVEMTLIKWLDQVIHIEGAQLIKVYKNIVMVLLEHNSYNQIIEYSLHIQWNKFFYMKTHYLDGKYFDIDIQESFAIVRGSDGHKVIYHSIHEGFQLQHNQPITEESWLNETYEQQDLDQYLIIPQMKQFYLTQFLNENFIVSISPRKLIFVRYLEIHPSVNCIMSADAEVGSVFQVQIFLNSTNCNEKQEESQKEEKQQQKNLIMCKKETNFKITAINGLTEEKTQYYYYVILLIISLFMLCCLLILIRIFFARYNNRQVELQGIIDNLGNKGYVIDKSQDSVSGF